MAAVRPRTEARPHAGAGSGGAAPTTGPRRSVSALERGFSVLHCFQPGITVLSHLEIARASGLPKATVSRITQTLAKLGYLDDRHEDGRFRLTAKTLEIGDLYLANVDVRAVAQPLMAELANDTRSTVNLVARNDDHLVVVETARSQQAVVAVNSRIGFRFPILQTAMGRAYVAGLPAAARAAAVKSFRSSVAAHDWAAMQQRVAKAVAECDARGFCVVLGEWRQGVNSVAAPLHAGEGRSEVYVLNCAGPATFVSRRALESDVGPRLFHIVRAIERAVNVSWKQP